MKHTLNLNEWQFNTFYNWVQVSTIEAKENKLYVYLFALIEIGQKLHSFTYIQRYPIKVKFTFLQMAVVQEIYLQFPQTDAANIIGTIVSDFNKKLL